MNQLLNIIAYKKQETQEQKCLYPAALLEKSLYFGSPCVRLSDYILRPGLNGIIAEFKRKSPSKGVLNAYAPVAETTRGYMQAGASALSILTDQHFFGGCNEDLEQARAINFCPILRKDFITDPYQVIEAKSIGADAILLIAAALTEKETRHLASLAHQLGMQVLLEIHQLSELGHLCEYINVVGINNRNLHTFEVNLHTSLNLLPQLPSDIVRISESGIRSAADAQILREAGAQGFLVGETFMRHSNPAQACATFIQSLSTSIPILCD